MADAAKRFRLSDVVLSLFLARLLLWLLAASQFLPGLLEDPPHRIAFFHDEHNILLHEEAARKTYVEYHQLPAWNPYFCGGMPGLANPPETSLSPDFLLRILFGVEPGRKLSCLLFVIMGMEGTFRLARRHRTSTLGAAMAGIAFSASGHFNYLLGVGWIFMFAYQLIPWVVLCFEEGISKKQYRIYGGMFVAWMVMSGGTYVTMYTGVILLLLVVTESGRSIILGQNLVGHRSLDPLYCLLIMALVAFGLTAIRVLPMLQIVIGHPRVLEQHDANFPHEMMAWIWLPKSDKSINSAAGDFYVGTIVCVLGLGAVLLGDKPARRFFAFALFFGLLACGEFVAFAPWRGLHGLPLYSQLRLPFRFAVIAAFFFALAGGRGLTLVEDGLLDTLRRRFPRLSEPGYWLFATLGSIFATIGFVAGSTDVVRENAIGRNSVYVLDPPVRYLQGFKQARGNRWDAHVWPYANLGSLQCFEENPLPQSPNLSATLKAEEYLAPGGDGTVTRVRWSPNMVTVRATLRKPSRVVVNQNHDPHFRVSVGTLVSHDGLLAADVPAGDYYVTFRYRNPVITAGAVVTLGTLLTLLFLGARRVFRGATSLLTRLRTLPW